MKLRLEPVVVHEDKQGKPYRLYWHGRVYRVTEIEDCWRYSGKWWLDGRGWHRAYFRVSARGIGGRLITVELYKQASNWVLSRECD